MHSHIVFLRHVAGEVAASINVPAVWKQYRFPPDDDDVILRSFPRRVIYHEFRFGVGSGSSALPA